MAVSDRTKSFEDLLAAQATRVNQIYAPQQPGSTGLSTPVVIDLDRHCAVTLPNGSLCASLLICKKHSTPEKANVAGRSAALPKLLELWKDSHSRGADSVNPDVQCAAALPDGGNCRRAITCGKHTIPQKKKILRSADLAELVALYKAAHARKSTDPIDLDIQCGVTLLNGDQCQRAITCQTHSSSERGQVVRSASFTQLLASYKASHALDSAEAADPDTQCAVIHANGVACTEALTCSEHTDAQKEQVARGADFHQLLALCQAAPASKAARTSKDGQIDCDTQCGVALPDGTKRKLTRSAEYSILLATYTATHKRNYSDTHCAVETVPRRRCTGDLNCSIHTKAEKREVQRTLSFRRLLKIQVAQTLDTMRKPGGFGLAVAAMEDFADAIVVRARYRFDGMQTASFKTHTLGHISSDADGENFNRMRQVLYEQGPNASGLLQTLNFERRYRKITTSNVAKFDGTYYFHLCGNVGAQSLDTKQAFQAAQHRPRYTDECVVTASYEQFGFTDEDTAVLLARLRSITIHVEPDLSKLTAPYKHMLLVCAFLHGFGDNSILKIPHKIDCGVVDNKPAILVETVQYDPATYEPSKTTIAVPLHDVTAEHAQIDLIPHQDRHPLSGLEAAKTWMLAQQLPTASQTGVVNLALHLLSSLNHRLISPGRARWIVGVESAKYNIALLLRQGEGRDYADVENERELATYNELLGRITPAAHVLELAPSLATIDGVYDADAAHWILQCLKCRFMHCKDIFIAWADAANAADFHKRYGVEALQPYCMCSREQAKTEIHTCRQCGHVVICRMLITVQHNDKEWRICKRCREPTEDDASSSGSSASAPTSPHAGLSASAQEDDEGQSPSGLTETEVERVKKRIGTLLAAELDIVYPNKAASAMARRRDRKDARDKMLQSYHEKEGNRDENGAKSWSWSDSYALDPITDTTGRMMCSIEANSPLVWHEGKLREHVAPNMVLTKLYLNTLCSTYPALCLRLFHGLDAATTVEEREEYIQRIDMLHVIRSQIPWKSDERLRSSFDESFMNAFGEECRTGAANPELCGRNTDANDQHNLWHLATSKAAKTPELAAVLKFIEDLEAQTGRPFRRINGVPFLYQCGPVPSADWSAKVMYAKYNVHYQTLKRLCNVRSTTDYDLPRLICAIFFVMQCPVHPPLLNLPVSPYIKSPLKMSVGKGDHAQGMTCGLPADVTITLQNFVAADCNLCVEPWVCNSAVGNRDDQRAAIAENFRKMLKRENPPFWDWDLKPLAADLVAKYITNALLVVGEFSESTPDSGVARSGGVTGAGGTSGGQTTGGQAGGQAGGEKPGDGEHGGGEPRGGQPGTGVMVAAHRRNMRNLGQTCFLSSVFQTLHNNPDFRSFVLDPQRMRYVVQTGRSDAYFLPTGVDPRQLNTEDTTAYRSQRMSTLALLFAGMRRLFGQLDQGGDQLQRSSTDDILDLVGRVNRHWTNKSNESAQLLGEILDNAIAASDKSRPTPGGYTLRYNAQQEDDNKTGRPLIDLGMDIETQWTVFREEGCDSGLAPLFFNQVAKEVPCGEDGCTTVTRSFEHTHVIYLDFPRSVLQGAKFTLQQLLDLWHFETVDDFEGHSCERNKDHAKSLYIYRALSKAAKWTCFPIRRGYGAVFNARHIVDLPLEMDLEAYMQLKDLPSQAQKTQQHTSTSSQTVYDLAAANIWKDGHYFLYVRDLQSAISPWLLFNDLNPYPVHKAPPERFDNGELVHYAVYKQHDATPTATVLPAGTIAPVVTTHQTPICANQSDKPAVDLTTSAKNQSTPLTVFAPTPVAGLVRPRPESSHNNPPPAQLARSDKSGDVAAARHEISSEANLLQREAALVKALADLERDRHLVAQGMTRHNLAVKAFTADQDKAKASLRKRKEALDSREHELDSREQHGPRDQAQVTNDGVQVSIEMTAAVKAVQQKIRECDNARRQTVDHYTTEASRVTSEITRVQQQIITLQQQLAAIQSEGNLAVEEHDARKTALEAELEALKQEVMELFK
ncbi:SAGA complex subunit Sgf73 [Oleoguttula sp. CCFEE 5521]